MLKYARNAGTRISAIHESLPFFNCTSMGLKMKRNYYITKNGRLKRKDNTLYLEIETGEKKSIPVEDVEGIYLMGETDLNTKLLDFLSQQKIPLHVFNYHGYYSGSYYPREHLNSGFLLVNQVEYYKDKGKRLVIAKE